MARPKATQPTPPAATSALDRLAALIDTGRTGGKLDTSAGYANVLGPVGLGSTGIGQNLMLSSFYPKVYGFWRPFATRAVLGLSKAQEREMARRMLDLGPGDTVLDVACGPGNFTGWYGSVVGPEGLAVGLDASPTMLAQGVKENSTGSAAYLLADAQHLPFADSSFDSVGCLLALFLMADPMQAVAEMTRVVRPGGRIAIMAPTQLGVRPIDRVAVLGAKIGGTKLVGRNQVSDALLAAGLEIVDRYRSRAVEYTSAAKPG